MTMDDDPPDLFEGEWFPPTHADNPALVGLADAVIAAIVQSVPQTQVQDLVNHLSSVPMRAEVLRQHMTEHVWFPLASRDTQLRRIRTIRDAAVAYGFPVCSTNEGYFLGDAAQVTESATRARRFAHGALARAVLLEKLANYMSGL